MTSDAGVPGAPRFDVVLRGYDRRQVDEHVDRLQRVLARMRADLEVARSQPMPAVAPSRPVAARPRPTPRPRPGGPADNPDTIGNFTDRMESILQSAEEEAGEIRRNAHLAARAETDGVRSQVADLIRQRDGVLAELTRMRSQLEGLLAAPTAQMPAHESGRPGAGRPDPDAARYGRPDPSQWPSDQGFRPAGGPGADPGRRSGSAPSTGPQPPVGPAPAGAPRPAGSGSAAPTPPAPGSKPGTPAPAGSTPSGSVATPSGSAGTSAPGPPVPAGSASQKPAAGGGAHSAGSKPVAPSAVPPSAVSPTSVTPVSGSQKPGPSPAPGGQAPKPPAAGAPSGARPSGPGTPAAPSSARPTPAPSSPAPTSPVPSSAQGAATTALPAGGTPPERRADVPAGGAAASSDNGASPATPGPAGSDAAPGTPPAGPEREAGKAAHRLPTGVYPAVADSSSTRPRSEPDAEPADLFRPVARGAGPDPQTTAVPRSTGDAPGERTSVVRCDDRTERGTTPPAAESTTKVGSVRPEEPTVLSPQPTTGRPDRGDGRNGTPRPTSPSRSA